MSTSDHAPLRVAPEVRDAIEDRVGVVALETTLLVHGLPPGDALQVASDIDATVRKEGAVPATVGVVAGEVVVGLTPAEVERLLDRRDDVRKLSWRDLGWAAAARIDGATTVASTIVAASIAGVSVMATGGIGGVHRGARESFDESADLVALARTSMLVVASGVKSILDVPATLERLDTLGVAVGAYRTDRIPGFYIVDSGIAAEWTVSTPADAALSFRAHRSFRGRGMLLANPVPVDAAMDPAVHDRLLADGLALCEEAGISGREVTPFLLGHFAKQSGGASVSTNIALVLDNAAVAARVARALGSP